MAQDSLAALGTPRDSPGVKGVTALDLLEHVRVFNPDICTQERHQAQYQSVDP
jgi:hypothetical protein